MTKTDVKKRTREGILSDKKFVAKFSLLSIAIILLSVLGIIQNRDDIFLDLNKFKTLKYESLSSIEKRLNPEGKNLNLELDNFNSLTELDLSQIELKEIETIGNKRVKTASIANADKDNKVIISSSTIKEKKTPKIIITSRPIGKNFKSLSSIKKRFYATHNIQLALKLSQKFYVAKKYKLALKWAMIANEINDKDEKSWILFAKSKVKLGKKEDALSALSEYLKHHKSANVKTLFDDIKRSS